MYNVDTLPDASVNCPRFADRSARSATSRSCSVISVRQLSPPAPAGQSTRLLPPRGRLPYGMGVFASLLAVVLLLIIGGLLLADRAIARGFNADAERDADATALALERWIIERRGSLRDFRGMFAHGGPPSADAFRSVASALASERPAIARIWLEDVDGTVPFDMVSGGAVEDETGSLILREPLVLDGELHGYAIGEFVRRGLLERIDELSPPTRSAVLVTSPSDTILRTSAAPRSFRGPLAPNRVEKARQISLPSGEHWLVRVTHTDNSRNVRGALWAVGLLAVSFLVAGVIRERRDAARVDERSHELERLSSELLRANRMKSEFLANVSHELRTPLNALVGFVDLLRDGVYGELTPRQAQPVERIAASATHLRHLVDQVLDIAKLAAGRLEVHPESVALRPFILDVASELESLMAEKGLTLSISVGSSLPRVRTDPTHLRQVLVNLLGNAVKFTPSGGISIRARHLTPDGTAPGDDVMLASSPDPSRWWVALAVTDTGIGISTNDHSRIFDEFEQVNPGPRGDSAERGTGLGLPISRRLARLLGGDLTVDSDVGRGATFTLWLPIDPAEISAAARPSREASARDSTNPPAPT
jgi:signal transduction histidine kinase